VPRRREPEIAAPGAGLAPEIVTMSARGSQTNDQGFAERLSPLIAKIGVVAVPALLLKYQGRLGLTDGEVVYVLHVLDHKRDGGWPWVAVGDVAAAMRRDERNVRSRKESLRAKGYLVCRAQRTAHGDRGADEHDLSGLFAELERLGIEERTAKALDQAREDLPAPTYYGDQLSVPRTPVQRLAVRRRRATDEPSIDTSTAPSRRTLNARGGGENAPTLPAKSSTKCVILIESVVVLEQFCRSFGRRQVHSRRPRHVNIQPKAR